MRQNNQLENIQSALQTVDWQNLQPNYPNHFDLLPRNLDASHILEIGASAITLASQSQQSFDELSFGTLSAIGAGESKQSFRLKTEVGSMVFHFLPFLAPESQPTDIKSNFITKIANSPTMTAYEFSDLSSYVTIPWSEQFSIRLQEDGGSATSSLGVDLSYMRAHHALQAAGIHLKGADKKIADAEMRHTRHHIKKPGYFRPLLIDVPIIVRH